MSLSHQGSEVDLTDRDPEDVSERDSFHLFAVFFEIFIVIRLIRVLHSLGFVLIRIVCRISCIFSSLLFLFFAVTGMSDHIFSFFRIQIHIFQHLRRKPRHLCPVHTASHHHVKRSLHAVPAHVQSARQCDHLSRLVLRPSAHAADFFISVISVVFQSISPDLSIVANIPYFRSHHIRSFFCKMRSKSTESFFFLNFSELP